MTFIWTNSFPPSSLSLLRHIWFSHDKGSFLSPQESHTTDSSPTPRVWWISLLKRYSTSLIKLQFWWQIGFKLILYIYFFVQFISNCDTDRISLLFWILLGLYKMCIIPPLGIILTTRLPLNKLHQHKFDAPIRYLETVPHQRGENNGI